MSRLWVADDGEVRVQPVVNASLAADHRVSDGHRGAKFLVEFQQVLQRPETLERTRADLEPRTKGSV